MMRVCTGFLGGVAPLLVERRLLRQPAGAARARVSDPRHGGRPECGTAAAATHSAAFLSSSFCAACTVDARATGHVTRRGTEVLREVRRAGASDTLLLASVPSMGSPGIPSGAGQSVRARGTGDRPSRRGGWGWVGWTVGSSSRRASACQQLSTRPRVYASEWPSSRRALAWRAHLLVRGVRLRPRRARRLRVGRRRLPLRQRGLPSRARVRREGGGVKAAAGVWASTRTFFAASAAFLSFSAAAGSGASTSRSASGSAAGASAGAAFFLAASRSAFFRASSACAAACQRRRTVETTMPVGCSAWPTFFSAAISFFDFSCFFSVASSSASIAEAAAASSASIAACDHMRRHRDEHHGGRTYRGVVWGHRTAPLSSRRALPTRPAHPPCRPAPPPCRPAPPPQR